jgi:hypothetical protein
MIPFKLSHVIPAMGLLVASVSSAATYYFDADGGNDLNSGMAPDQAWRNLSKANSHAFQPGDQILLQRGDSFTGKIYLNGDSGTADNPIIIGAYGAGDDPLISCVGYRAGVHIRNAEYVEVSDLEITGDGGAMVDGTSNNRRYGVVVDASGTGASFRGITVRDLFIHDIYPRDGDGSEGATPIPPDHPDAGKQKAITWYGTGILVQGVSSAVSSDVLVENCRIERMGYKAIEMKRVEFIDVIGNYMEDIGGPAIQPGRVNDLVVRGNTVHNSGNYSDPRMHGRGSGIWPWTSERVLIEKNTFTGARGRADSCGIHIDFNCKDVIVQYNLSIDNAGGFIEILGNNYNCTYRYNISINDRGRIKGQPSNGPGTLNNFQEGHTFWISGYVGSGNPSSGPFNQYIYNNTVYVTGDITAKFSVQDTNLGLLVANNIFYIEGASEDITSDSSDNYTQNMVDHVVWENNLYRTVGNVQTFYNDVLSGPSFTDTDPKYGNPLFANKGGLAAVDYIPSSTSLIEDKGIIIDKLPDDSIGLKIGLPVGEDFFGNPIIGLPDMGAVEIGGTPFPLPGAAFDSLPAYKARNSAEMTSIEGPYNTEYYFTETSGNFGGDDSGWQLSPVYVDDGLLPNTTYHYTVTMRDALDAPGSASSGGSVAIPGNDPFENPVILMEDFSSSPDPANTIEPYPLETWFVGSDTEAQDGSVNTTGGELRVGWGYDAVSVYWLADRFWDTSRDYRFTGKWIIANVLDVHLGMTVGIGEFDPVTGALVQAVKELTIGDLVSPTIGQNATFLIDVTAAELATAGVSDDNRIGIYFLHDGDSTPARNDVYLVDNLDLQLLGGEADSDGDGIPDSAEPGLGLNPLDITDGALDPDGDGWNNFAEYFTGTDLNDPADYLQLGTGISGGDFQVQIPGASILDRRLYILEHSSGLGQWTAVDAASGADAGPGLDLDFTFTELGGQDFFRIRVEWE